VKPLRELRMMGNRLVQLSAVSVSPARVKLWGRYGGALEEFMSHRRSSEYWDLGEVAEQVEEMPPWEMTAWMLVAYEKSIGLEGPAWETEREFWSCVEVVVEMGNEDDPGLGDLYLKAAKVAADGNPEECARRLADHRSRYRKARRRAEAGEP
jgi:hypothetical protein